MKKASPIVGAALRMPAKKAIPATTGQPQRAIAPSRALTYASRDVAEGHDARLGHAVQLGCKTTYLRLNWFSQGQRDKWITDLNDMSFERF